MANDWADGSDLASMSRGGNLLQSMGYDPDEVRMNPQMRAEMMSKLAGPYDVASNKFPPRPAAPVVPSVETGRPGTPAVQPGSTNPATMANPSSYLQRRPSPSAQPVPDTLQNATAPPTSSAVSPSGTPTPQSMAGGSNDVDIANARGAAASLTAPQPELPNTTVIDNKITDESIPTNPNLRNAAGKQPYREGLLGRIGRGFEAAGVGFMKGGVPGAVGGAVDPAVVGVKPYGSPNSDYDIEDQNRQAQLALAQKQKADFMAAYDKRMASRKQADEGAKAGGEISTNLAKLPNETTTANADAARAYNESPAGKAEAAKELSAQTLSDRQAQLADPKSPLSKLSRSDQAYFLASGKAPNPDTYHAPAEQVLFQHALQAWQHDHPGQTPGLEDMRNIVSGSKGADPEETTRVRAAADTLAAASKRLVAATTAASKIFSPHDPRYAQAQQDVAAAQKTYDEAVAGMEKPAAPSGPGKPKLVGGAWQGMEGPQPGKVPVTAPNGTPGYATPAWLAKHKDYKRAQ